MVRNVFIQGSRDKRSSGDNHDLRGGFADVRYTLAPTRRTTKRKVSLVKNGKNQGIFSSFEDAHKEAVEKFDNQDVVIGQVGIEPPLNYIASVV